MSYNEALEEHIKWLEERIKGLEGVQQGFLIRDCFGDVVDRVGRVSMNPPWYQEAYRVYGRRPSKRQLREIAEEHLSKGFWDFGGFIPPLKDRLYS